MGRSRRTDKTSPEQDAASAAAGGNGPTETSRGGARRPTDADMYPPHDVWNTMKEIARTIITSGFVPEELTGDHAEEKVLTIMLRGRALGIEPTQAITSIYVNADGVPSMRAELMRSQIAKSGVGELVIDEYTDEVAAVRGIRYGRDGRPDRETPFRLTADDVRKLGSKMDRGLPRHTLIARVTSECARMVFSDVLAGVVYTPEDLEGHRRPPAQSKPPVQAAPPPKQDAKPAAVAQEGTKAPATAPQAGEGVAQATSGAATPASGAPTQSAPAAEAAPVGGQPEGGAPPAASEPPPSGIPDSGVPGRPWVGIQNLRIPGRDELVPTWTHGITATQLHELGAMSAGKPDLIEVGKNWLTERGLPKLTYLTQAEGEQIIAFLKGKVNGASDQGRMQWAEARAQLDVVIERFGLQRYKAIILEQAAQKYDVPGIEALPAEKLYGFIRDLQEQGEQDQGGGLRLALERLVEPEGGATA